LRGALAERGVDPALTLDAVAPSGTMLVVVEAGERSMVADRGANARLTPDDLPASLDAGAVLVSGYLLLQEPTTPSGIAALERASAMFVGVEAASWPLIEAFGAERFLSETVRAGANVVLANEREAEELVGRSNAAAARALGERYRVACVKLGVDGAVMSFDGALVEATAEPIIEVDATGAGDAFDGVLLAALARGEPPEVALERACHAGASVAASEDIWPPEDPA
jgi:ribokinase